MSPKAQETIFEAALALPPEQRAAYLDQSCGADAQLRKGVEALLQAHDKAGGFMNEPVGGLPSKTVRMPVTERPGDKIGHYKLLQQIGEGGCGVVYMAEQQEPIHRRVAFKVIKLGMDTRQVIARFEAERQALALMDHPNIARVLDAGATDTGRPYFVMELVRGIRITDYCDQNSLSTEARLDLFIQVCHAIQHAHQKGIIHRDIKPSNILVTVNDGVPVPKVIDFGIAKATGGQLLTDKTLFTAFEQFIGTPAYMSPEQAEMTSLDVDTRADVYALGVLLYELLTGHAPFDPKTLLAAGLDEMRRIIRETEPMRPSTRLSSLDASEQTTVARCRHSEPPKLVHQVRGDLDWIVMKCLEKDRTRRYETANGLANDLSRHLRNEPVSAAAPGAVYRAAKFIRRHKAGLATTAALVLLLMGGLVVSTWQAVRARKAEIKAETEANKSKQVARFLSDMLEGVGPSVALGRDTKLLREILDKTAARAGTDLTNQPEVEAELRTTMGTVYRELGASDRAEQMYQIALRLWTAVRGTGSLEEAELQENLSQALCGQSRNIEAEALVRRALAQERKLLPPDHADIALSLNDLAVYLHQQGKFPEAEARQREALAMRQRLFQGDHPNVAESLDNLGSTLFAQDKLAEAEPYQRQALAMRRRLFGEVSPQVAFSLNSLGSLLYRACKLEEAQTMFEEALAVRWKLQGPAHPDIATSLNNVGGVLLLRGKYDEAETNLLRGLAMRKMFLGTNHMDVAESLNNLAVLYQRQGRLVEAEAAQTEQLELSRRVLGRHPRTATSLNNLAIVQRGLGKLQQAEKTQREALDMQRSLFDKPTQDLAVSLSNLGRLLCLMGRFEEAEGTHREALSTYKAVFGDEHPVLPPVVNDLALALEGEGKLATLEAQLRHSLQYAERAFSNNWNRFNTCSLLGGSLLAQERYAEAEPLLVSGFKGLAERRESLPSESKPRLQEAAGRLARLYDATGRGDQATQLRKEYRCTKPKPE